mgnify:CR=1 FL=1
MISYEASMIDEVVITAKKVVDKLLPEPTDIEIVGNQYIIHPKVKIPKEMYKPNTRIVVQPMLVNITRKTQNLFRPAVVTGKGVCHHIGTNDGIRPEQRSVSSFSGENAKD